MVHRVISAYPHRFLLCDEVGLGKTIEAGVILKELRARKSADRVLIVVPPNLMRQWQFELKTKFNETFSIINSETVKYLRNQHGADTQPVRAHRQRHRVELVDHDWGVDRARHRVSIGTSSSSTRRTMRESGIAGTGSSGRSSTGWSSSSSRRRPSPSASALFLTATPMQLDPDELYSLIELLDPALFPTVEHFDQPP